MLYAAYECFLEESKIGKAGREKVIWGFDDRGETEKEKDLDGKLVASITLVKNLICV